MATVLADAKGTLVNQVAAQYTGANLADIQAICRDAREDTTNEKFVSVPISRNRRRNCHIGDWVISVSAGDYLVIENASFTTIFTTH